MSIDTVAPDLAEVIEEALRWRLCHVHTNLPGKVLSYNATTQLADILPVGKHRQPISEDSFATVDYPIIPEVPVAFPRWGSWYIHAPLAAGDYVDVLFAEASFDRWRESGEDTVDPLFGWRHHLTDAIAVPSNLYPAAKALANLNTSGLELGREHGTKIVLDDAGVRLGSREAAQLVATANKVIAVFQAFRPALAALQTYLPTPMPPTEPALLATYTTALSGAQVALTTLNAQLAALVPDAVGSPTVKAP